MHKGLIIAIAEILSGALPGCAQERHPALTQWGTPCDEYGLSPKECHAKFANYADFLASPTKSN